MNLPEHDNHPDALDERIEAWLDGDLDGAEAAEMADAAERDPAVAARAETATAVRDLLRSLPAEAFPRERLAHVLSVARRDARKDRLGRLVDFIRGPGRLDWRPAVAMASLVVLMTVVVVVGGRPGGSRVTQDPAVTEALQQVRWTLGYVADISRRTGRTVRNDVLQPHVVTPVHDAVAHVFESPKPSN